MRVARIDSSRLTLERSYPAVAASVPQARRLLRSFAADAGAGGDQLEGIVLTVSEAVTNVVQHAYCEGPGGAVHVSATVVSGELWILVADDGRGLEPTRESPGLGLGLAWMAQFSDGLTLVPRSGGGLEARLRFDLLAGSRRDGGLTARRRTATASPRHASRAPRRHLGRAAPTCFAASGRGMPSLGPFPVRPRWERGNRSGSLPRTGHAAPAGSGEAPERFQHLKIDVWGRAGGV